MKKKIAFVCTHNSCRSIMAEAWAKHYGKDIIEAYSAGTEPNLYPKPLALEVMQDAGIDVTYSTSKLLDEIPDSFDVLITMGCGVKCPFIPAKHREDWGIIDPSGGDKVDFEKTRDIIRIKVLDLIKRVKNY